MRKEDFERQVNALVPIPDFRTTAALFAFGQELGQTSESDGVRDLLNAVHFISRHFDREVLQNTYEMKRHGSAALPEELVAAAVLLQDGDEPESLPEQIHRGYLLGFYAPKAADEISPLALCCILERRVPHLYHTEHFGGFDPEAVFSSAKEFAGQQGISVTAAFRHIAADGAVHPGVHVGQRLLSYGQPEMTDALNDIFACCPAVAAWVTFDVDQDNVSVNYNPQWLELQQRQEPVQSGMELPDQPTM